MNLSIQELRKRGIKDGFEDYEIAAENKLGVFDFDIEKS